MEYIPILMSCFVNAEISKSCDATAHLGSAAFSDLIELGDYCSDRNYRPCAGKEVVTLSRDTAEHSVPTATFARYYLVTSQA